MRNTKPYVTKFETLAIVTSLLPLTTPDRDLNTWYTRNQIPSPILAFEQKAWNGGAINPQHNWVTSLHKTYTAADTHIKKIEETIQRLRENPLNPIGNKTLIFNQSHITVTTFPEKETKLLLKNVDFEPIQTLLALQTPELSDTEMILNGHSNHLTRTGAIIRNYLTRELTYV